MSKEEQDKNEPYEDPMLGQQRWFPDDPCMKVSMLLPIHTVNTDTGFNPSPNELFPRNGILKALRSSFMSSNDSGGKGILKFYRQFKSWWWSDDIRNGTSTGMILVFCAQNILGHRTYSKSSRPSVWLTGKSNHINMAISLDNKTRRVISVVHFHPSETHVFSLHYDTYNHLNVLRSK